MTSYTYPHPSTIDHIHFIKSEDGGERAYVCAREGVDTDQLLKIASKLQKEGYQNVASSHEHRGALEVRGVKEAKFIDYLKSQGWVSGTPEREKASEKDIGFIETIKQRSMFVSALLYILGDIKFITYGIKGGSPLNIAGGVFYGLGTQANLMFNRKSNADVRVHDLAKEMADHMNQMNVELPKDSAICRILDDKEKTTFEKIDEYGRHYPSELMNLCFAAAGACIAVAAYKKLTHSELPAGMVDEFIGRKVARAAFDPVKLAAIPTREAAEKMLTKFHKASNALDVGLGSMTFTSGMFGALVREKAHDPDQPRKQGLAGLWEWVQERPLAITGAGLMVSTMCHAVSTGIEWRIGTTDGKKAIIDRGVFVASALMAEFLIAISSKGHGEGVKSDKTIDDSAMSIAAELIARHPDAEQPMLIEHMAKFIGGDKVLAIDDEVAAQKLREEVERMKKNPWALHTASEKRSLPDATWQQKVTSSQPVLPQLGV